MANIISIDLGELSPTTRDRVVNAILVQLDRAAYEIGEDLKNWHDCSGESFVEMSAWRDAAIAQAHSLRSQIE